MKLLIMLNQDYPLNRLMNALAQMSFGLGHRLDGEPDVNIVFGDTAQIRAFRTRAAKLADEKPALVFSSDFPNTMVGMSTDDLLNNVVNTAEADVVYFGACYIAKDLDPQLAELAKAGQSLSGYKPHKGDGKAQFVATNASSSTTPPTTPKKITMLLNKTPMAETINHAVLSNLAVAKSAPVQDQYLLNIGSKDEGKYFLTSISFHSNIIAKTDAEMHGIMATAAAKSSSLYSNTRKKEDVPIVTVVFGELSEVESTIPKTQTRLFGDTLGKKALTPVQTNKEVSDFFLPNLELAGKNPEAFFNERVTVTAASTADLRPTSEASMSQ